MGRADLHTHTTASDGAAEPADLVRMAYENRLELLSITDHDTIDGYLEAREEAATLPIQLIPGIELTTLWQGRELHLLGYGFDPADSAFMKLLVSQRRARKDRIGVITHRLQKLGLDVDPDEVFAVAGRSMPGRPHVARVLTKKGYTGSVHEAFVRYLGNEVMGSLDLFWVHLEAASEAVRGAGGVVVIAHPGRTCTYEEVEEMCNDRIDGIECIHPSHGYDHQLRYTRMAERWGLLVSGGSDFHGSGTHEAGSRFGTVTVESGRAERILQRCSSVPE
ncbi:MAG: PHP domain-containing protein [Balneolaceae bacterium]